jgi:AcrR family transcriptional regulator
MNESSHSPPTTAAQRSLRREPQQARSRRRVAAVLEAAERVLVAEGAGGLTTTRVAQEAGISVGSLYQWFPDKEAIVEALALQYVDGFRALMASLAETAQTGPGDDPAGAALDTFADAFRNRPGFTAMWFGGLRTEHLRDVTRPIRDELAASVARILAAAAPAAPAERVTAVARMAVLVADGVLRPAVSAGRPS